MTERDPVSGGIVETPAGVDERHVLLTDNTWAPRPAPRFLIREFGGCMLLGSGQMVPIDGTGGETAAGGTPHETE